MELMQAVAAHTRFNRMISSYVSRPDHSLNASLVGAADRCDLGRWIIGEGSRRYASMPEFSTLVASHAHYHQAAAAIVSRADLGQAEVQETNLGSTSEFAYASTGVVRALMFPHGKIVTDVIIPSRSSPDGPAEARPFLR